MENVKKTNKFDIFKVVCSMASLTKPSFTKLHVESSDEFDCPPNILEKLMSQTIRDLFTVI